MIDIHTLTHEQFCQLPLLVEGESKIVRDAGHGNVVIALKPSIYSYTSNRNGDVPGSEHLRIKAAKIFNDILQKNGIDTAYKEVGEKFIFSRYIQNPPPIEVIVKAFHVGTPKHRYYKMSAFPIRKNHPKFAGFKLTDEGPYPEPMVRFDWRNPMYHPETQERLADEVLGEEQADWFIDTKQAKKTAHHAFKVLSDFLIERKIVLCDICFFISSDGKTIFGEVSPDCARFRHLETESLDKDIWRLGGSSAKILAKWQRLLEIIN